MRLTTHARERATRRRLTATEIADLVLREHWSPSAASSLSLVVDPQSYYTPDGDLAYLHVRKTEGPIRSEEQAWGLEDYDERTGELVGIEVWGASKSLSAELIATLPRLTGRGPAIARGDLAERSG